VKAAVHLSEASSSP